MKLSFPVPSILLLGPTGVGKSPLGDTIARTGLLGRRCHHLDFGSELRSAVSGGRASAPFSEDERSFIHGVLERGLLLENEHFSLAKKIISLFLDRTRFSDRDLLVLNGIPRHPGQAGDMSAVARVLALIVLDCTVDDVFFRIHHNTGGDRSERQDDDRVLIEKKLKIFRERTAPLVEYYRQTGSAVYRFRISGSTTAEQAYQEVSALASTHPPVTLVAEPPE